MKLRHRDFIKENRLIRVFISSSFEDMDDERNILIDPVFPSIRQKARRKGVDVTALDLRWGIPDGTDIGDTINICMNEIDNSYPFFIGILGKHYGTQPDKNYVFDKNEALKEQFKVLEKYFEKHLSITDMEMRYGVLDRSQAERQNLNALFLIREADMPDIQSHPLLHALNTEILSCADKYTEEKVKNSNDNHIWVSNYSSVEELAKIVEIVFDKLLEHLFPEELSTDSFRAQAFMQKATLSDLERYYIPNQNYLENLDTFITGEEQRYLVYGESGCGKSSLLAYWISKRRKQNIDIIYHFIGLGDVESAYRTIEDRLLYELYSNVTVNTEEEKKEKTLREFFAKTTINRPLIIVIDALNQLIDGKELKWLLFRLPQNVKLICSTLTGDETEKVFLSSSNGSSLKVVGLLDPNERIQLIKEYLLNFHRRDLGEKNIHRLSSWPLSINPFALKTALNELIFSGRFNKMDSLVEYYSQCPTIESLFEAIFRRLDSNPNYSWAQFVFGAITLSRTGLSEDEIFRITNVPKLYWSSFFSSYKTSFLIRNGILSFSHQHIRDAVKRIYLKDENIITKIHWSLIPIFEHGQSSREHCELVYHYFKLGEFKKVYNLIIQPNIFCELWNDDTRLVASYWEKLITLGFSPEPLVHVNRGELDATHCDLTGEPFFTYCHNLQKLLSRLHKHKLMVVVVKSLEEYMREEGTTKGDHMRMYRDPASSHKDAGDFYTAIEYYKKSFFTWHKGGEAVTGYDDENPDLDSLNCQTYCSMAFCYRQIGNLENAERFLANAKKSFEIDIDKTVSSSKYDKETYIYIHLEQYQISKIKGDCIRMQDSLQHCLDVCRTLEFLSSQIVAEVLYYCGYYQDSIRFLNMQIKSLKGELSIKDGIELGMAYREVAKSLYKMGKINFAERFIEASLERLSKQDETIYQRALSEEVKGLVLKAKREFTPSLRCFLFAASVYKKMKIWPKWVDTWEKAAIVNYYLGQKDKAFELLSEAIDTAINKMAYKEYRLGELYENLSFFFFYQKDFKNSFYYTQEAYKRNLGVWLSNRAKLHKMIIQLDKCIKNDPSIINQLDNPPTSTHLSGWDRYVILTKGYKVTSKLKANLCWYESVGNRDIWKIVVSLIGLFEEETIMTVLGASSTEKILDNVIFCLERKYGKSSLQGLFTLIIFSPDGVSEKKISTLPEETQQLIWLLLDRNGLFIRKGKKFYLFDDILKTVILSHYYKYDYSDKSLENFANAMYNVCPKILIPIFSSNAAFYKQLKRDAIDLADLLVQIKGKDAHEIAPALIAKTCMNIGRYISDKDDISLALSVRFFQSLASHVGFEHPATQKAAAIIQQCINYESCTEDIKGYTSFVLGAKAYKEEDYISALRHLYNYFKTVHHRAPYDIQSRWYRMATECKSCTTTFEVDDIPQTFFEALALESKKYRHINNDFLRYFKVEKIDEDKLKNRIIIHLNEPYNVLDPSKFRFLRYGIETKITMAGHPQVIILCLRGLWLNLYTNEEVRRLYPIKLSGVEKNVNFATFVRHNLKYGISDIRDKAIL